MEIINNKYRIVKKLNEYICYVTYLVYQISNEEKYYELNLLKVDSVSSNSIGEFEKSLSYLRCVHTKNIVSIIDYDIVQSIDGKLTDDVKYYYVCEHNENKVELSSISSLSYDEIGKMFIELCQSIALLHAKERFYENICFDNVFLEAKKQSHNLILRDMYSSHFIKYEKKYSADDDLWEFTRFQLESPADRDLCSLGILLVGLINKTINSKSITSILKKYREFEENNPSPDNSLYSKLMKLAFNMIFKNGIISVSNAILQYNQMFNVNFPIFKKMELEQLNFDTELIARQEYIDSVVESYNKFKMDNSPEKVYVLYGEEGVGKSKALKGISYYFQSIGERVFSNLNKRFDAKDDSISLSIIKKMIENCPEDVMAHQEETINDILVGMENKNILLQKNTTGMDKIRLIFINRAGAFIREYCKARPVIIIIDDIESTDSITIDLIKYICSMNCKVFIIMSYRYEKSGIKSDFEKWISDPVIRKNVVKKLIKSVGRIDSDKITSQILGIKETPNDIGITIFELAKGNPLLIEETIKNLYVTNKIYIDISTGLWSIKKTVESGELTDIKDAVKEQLKGLNGDHIYALQLLSILKNPVSNKLLESAKDKLKLCERTEYSKLINGNILEVIYEEDTFTVDFNNRYMKSVIRSTVNKELYEEISTIIIEILEENYNHGDQSILDELLCHVDRINDKNKIIKYSVETAKLCFDRHLDNKALTYFEKALSMYETKDIDKFKIDIMINIGQIYFRQFNFDMAQSIYKKAFDESSSLDDKDTSILILEYLCDVYECTRNIEKLQFYMLKMEELVEGNWDSYHKGQICHLKSIYQSYIGKMHESMELSNQALDIIQNDHDILKSRIYNTLCFININIGKIEDALKCANLAIKYALEYNNNLVLYKAYTNLAVIYCDYNQDVEKCVKYSKLAKDIAEKYGEILTIIRARNNLSICYFYKHEYDEVIKECKENQQMMSDIRSFDNIYCNIIYCNCNVILENISEAYESYRRVWSCYEQMGHTEDGNNKLEHYSIMMCFTLWSGNYEATLQQAQICSEINLNDIIIYYDYIKIYEASANIFLGKNVQYNFEIINDNIKKITNYSYSLNMITTIAKYYILHDKEQEITDFIKTNIRFIDEKINMEDKVEVCSYNLLKAILEDDYSMKINMLKENIRLSRNIKLYETYYISALYMRKIYIEQGDNIGADICLCIAAMDLRKMLFKCNDRCYESYVTSHNLEKYFGEILSTDKYFNSKGKVIGDLYNFVQNENVNLKLDSFRAEKKLRKFKNIYNYYDNYVLNDFDSIVEMLNGDDYNNVSVLNKYFSHTFFADKSIIISNLEDRFHLLHSTEGNNQIDINMEEILRRCKTTKQIIKKYDGESAVTFCIPIIISSNIEQQNIQDRRKNNIHKESLVGYIFIEIDPIFEPYVERRIFRLGNVIKLAGIVLDKINLKNSAFYDRLTGALTRKYLESTFKEALDNSKKNKQQCSVLMLDLDKFKFVNDNFGHQVGDKVLRDTSELIRNKIRTADIFGRYGGEELLVVLPNSDVNAGIACAEKLRKAIEDSRMLGNRRKITVSIGVSCFPGDGQDTIELIEKADKALYIAKNRGRNQVVAWDEDFSKYSQGIQHLSSTVMKTIMQEEKRFSFVLEVIKLIKENKSVKEKLEKVTTIISDITGSEIANLLLLNKDGTVSSYIQINDNVHQRNTNFNEKLINEVKSDKKGIFVVDWDNPFGIDPVSNIPDWKSVMVSPVLYSEMILAMVYLTVSTKTKEFSYEDYSMVNLLLSIATPLLMELYGQRM